MAHLRRCFSKSGWPGLTHPAPGSPAVYQPRSGIGRTRSGRRQRVVRQAPSPSGRAAFAGQSGPATTQTGSHRVDRAGTRSTTSDSVQTVSAARLHQWRQGATHLSASTVHCRRAPSRPAPLECGRTVACNPLAGSPPSMATRHDARATVVRPGVGQHPNCVHHDWLLQVEHVLWDIAVQPLNRVPGPHDPCLHVA